MEMKEKENKEGNRKRTGKSIRYALFLSHMMKKRISGSSLP